jgi:hypothetical protein
MTQQQPQEPYQPVETENPHGRRSRRAFSGIFPGLLLILLGVLFFLTTQGTLSWNRWWQYFLVGLGAIFLIEAIVRYATGSERGFSLGRIIAGLVLISVGASFLFNMVTWWPIILIVVGLVILVAALFRR